MNLNDDNEEKIRSIGHPVEEASCTCVDQHLMTPYGIESQRCAYCRKRIS